MEFTHVRDVDLAESPDPVVLQWAALHGLVLVTHDRTTVPPFAYARVAAGLPMPGVFLVSDAMPVGQAIEELLIAAHCLSADDCANLVLHKTAFWPRRMFAQCLQSVMPPACPVVFDARFYRTSPLKRAVPAPA